MNSIAGETAGCDAQVVEEIVWHFDPHIPDVAFAGSSEAPYPRYKRFGICEIEQLVGVKTGARFTIDLTAALNERGVHLQGTRCRLHRETNDGVFGVDTHVETQLIHIAGVGYACQDPDVDMFRICEDHCPYLLPYFRWEGQRTGVIICEEYCPYL